MLNFLPLGSNKDKSLCEFAALIPYPKCNCDGSEGILGFSEFEKTVPLIVF